MTQFTLSAFADEASPEFDRQIAALHRKHIPLMEIRGVDGKGILDLTDEELYIVEKKLAASNIGISAIGSPIGKIGIEDDFAPHFEKFKRAVEIAKKLHTTRIRMFSFYIPEGKNSEIYHDTVIERIQKMVDYGEANGVHCATRMRRAFTATRSSAWRSCTKPFRRCGAYLTPQTTFSAAMTRR